MFSLRFMRPSVLAFVLLSGLLQSGSLLAQFGEEDDKFSLNMREVEISEFINTVAKLTGKTIVADDRVSGKVNIDSRRELTREQLYEVFLLQLGVNGFSVVDVGNGILKVIPNQAAKIQGIEVQTDNSPAPLRSERIVTRIAQVNNVDVDKLIPTLRPLIDNKTGVITPYGESNILVITDRESNVRRLLAIIEQVDRAGSQRTETIVLEHASAGELQRIIERIVKESRGGAGGPKPEISSDARTNSLIIQGDSQVRATVRKLVKELDIDVSRSSNIRVHYLKYAKAEDMAKVLKSVSDSIIKNREEGNQGGARRTSSLSIEADEDTNAVVLSGSPELIRNLEGVIEKLDIRRAQVLVEAIIIELTDNRTKELGIQWLFRGDQNGTAPIGGIDFGGAAPSIFGVAGAALGDDPSVVTTALGGIQGLTLGVGKIRSDGFSFATLINALAGDSESNILSTPSLLTMDNQEATISVGQEIPVITGATAGANNTNPFQTISRQDVGIRLTVTPRINEGDAVQLEIEQEVSSLSGALASDIVTNKRLIDTSVLVNDGATIVLGGLIDDDIQESTSKVPILGDIPLLGRLFRADRTQKVKRNLLVFIRPTIVRDQSRITQLSNEKYSYIRAQQIMMHDGGVNLFPGAESPVLPSWDQDEISPPQRYQEAIRLGSGEADQPPVESRAQPKADAGVPAQRKWWQSRDPAPEPPPSVNAPEVQSRDANPDTVQPGDRLQEYLQEIR